MSSKYTKTSLLKYYSNLLLTIFSHFTVILVNLNDINKYLYCLY